MSCRARDCSPVPSSSSWRTTTDSGSASMARDKLNQIIEMQRDYQRQLGHDFEKMTLRKRIAYILEMSYALEDEVHESTKEVGWKSWARSKHINEEAYR